MKKKAFTMIEVLVCLVCIGILTACIGTFASAIKLNASLLDEREIVSSNEYQDVLNIKAHGATATGLNYSDYLIKADKHKKAQSFSIADKFTIDTNDKVEIKSSNNNVVIVDNHGNCRSVGPGLAYIEIQFSTKGNDGEYHDLGVRKYIPVFVYDEDYEDSINTFNYYFYGGKYYTCWLCY